MNASIYMDKKTILSHDNIFFKTSLYLYPEDRSIDIDSPLDFKVVKYLIEKINMVINNSIRLKDKNAYVLGGLGLIGSSISKKFLHNGSKVVILDKDKKAFDHFINKNKFKNQNITFDFFDCADLTNIETNLKK